MPEPKPSATYSFALSSDARRAATPIKPKPKHTARNVTLAILISIVLVIAGLSAFASARYQQQRAHDLPIEARAYCTGKYTLYSDEWQRCYDTWVGS